MSLELIVTVLIAKATSLGVGGYLGYRYGRIVEARAIKVRMALLEAVAKARS